MILLALGMVASWALGLCQGFMFGMLGVKPRRRSGLPPADIGGPPLTDEQQAEDLLRSCGYGPKSW